MRGDLLGRAAIAKDSDARRFLRGFVVALSMLLPLAAGVARGAEEDEACLACHDDVVDPAAFGRGAHASDGCAACHPGREEHPHPEDAPPPDCALCHEDAVKGLAASPHGTPPAPGMDPLVGCADCHGSPHRTTLHTESTSPVHWSNVAGTCARCHADETVVGRYRIPVARPVEAYLESVHARAVQAGKRAAVCSDCHGAHAALPASDPASPLARANVAATCGTCHEAEAAAYRDSVHGAAMANGVRDAPACTDCHGEHAILGHEDPSSPVFAANIAPETCGRCHGSIRLSRKYGMEREVVQSFADSFHGLALRAGQLTAANCASCHGVHDILPASDPRSHVAPARLAETCGQCHPGATDNFALGPVHVLAATASARFVGWIRNTYLWLIGLVVGGMAVHNLLDIARKMRRPSPPVRVVPRDQPERMSRALRWQHGLVMVSFPVLVYTGFALTYPEARWAQPVLAWESELGLRGGLHRVAALVMVAALVWHLMHLAASRRLRACFRRMLPGPKDARDLLAAFGWYLGLRATPPHPGTFGYVEKAEYWAFMWGSVLMAATGFVLWFESVALRWVPKWFTDVATALHFWEAVLATLAIVFWHLYWVIFDPDVYPMDASWWHGRSPATRVAERAEPSHRDDEPA